MFILVTNFFRSNQVFLDSNQNIQLRTSHYCWRRCFFLYHSTRIFRNYFVSCNWGTVCPLENVNLFGVLDPVEQPAKFKKFESKQTAMNSSLHEELRALVSKLLRWSSYKTCNPTFFFPVCAGQFWCRVCSWELTMHIPLTILHCRWAALLKRQKGQFFGNQNQELQT